MSDALTAAPEGPQTDALVEQPEAPRPVEKPNLDDTLRTEVEKAVKARTEAEKQPKEPVKAEEKPAEKPEDARDRRRAAMEKALGKKLAWKEGDERPATAPKAPPSETEEDDSDEGEEDDDEADDAPDVAQRYGAKEVRTAFHHPPHGFDDAAKKEWESVPESVRGAMHRRAQEMERGIHKYRQDAEQFDTVRQFAEMAKQGGTDLATALHQYTSMEAELRRDPISGLQQIVANLGLKGANGQPATLRDIAAHILGQPANQAASRQEAQISQLTQQVQSLKQQLGGFSKHMETQQQEAKVSSASNEWTAFQRENPRATELEPRIAEFLTKYPADIPAGERLRDAYNWAVAQNPSVAHTDQQPLAQTQTQYRQPNPAGTKSVSGTGGESRTVRKISSDEALKKAIAKITG